MHTNINIAYTNRMREQRSERGSCIVLPEDAFFYFRVSFIHPFTDDIPSEFSVEEYVRIQSETRLFWWNFKSVVVRLVVGIEHFSSIGKKNRRGTD